jgi:hypothetical protein
MGTSACGGLRLWLKRIVVQIKSHHPNVSTVQNHITTELPRNLNSEIYDAARGSLTASELAILIQRRRIAMRPKAATEPARIASTTQRTSCG